MLHCNAVTMNSFKFSATPATQLCLPHMEISPVVLSEEEIAKTEGKQEGDS